MSVTSYEKACKALLHCFNHPSAKDSEWSASVILTVIEAKLDAVGQGGQRFERLLLDVGRFCDQRLDTSNATDVNTRKNFLKLVSLLQKVSETSKRINKLAFFARGIPDSNILAEILDTWNELYSLKQGLFNELFVNRPLSSDILGRMGRKRLINLAEGLESISAGSGTLSDIQKRLDTVEKEEQLVVILVTTIQDMIGNNYGWVAGNNERETIKRMVSIELRHRRFLSGDIPDRLFDVGLNLAKSSLMYMNTLLPIIIANRDVDMREEFIRDSGIDRLLIEELEERWCERENLDRAHIMYFLTVL